MRVAISVTAVNGRPGNGRPGNHVLVTYDCCPKGAEKFSSQAIRQPRGDRRQFRLPVRCNNWWIEGQHQYHFVARVVWSIASLAAFCDYVGEDGAGCLIVQRRYPWIENGDSRHGESRNAPSNRAVRDSAQNCITDSLLLLRIILQRIHCGVRFSLSSTSRVGAPTRSFQPLQKTPTIYPRGGVHPSNHGE